MQRSRKREQARWSRLRFLLSPCMSAPFRVGVRRRGGESGNGESLPSLPRRTRCLPAHSPAVLPRVNASVQSIETSLSLAHTLGSTQVSSKAIPPLPPIRNFGRSKESSTTSPHAVAPRRTAFCLIPPSRAGAHSDKLPGNAHARSRTIISTRDGSSAPIHPPRAPAAAPHARRQPRRPQPGARAQVRMVAMSAHLPAVRASCGRTHAVRIPSSFFALPRVISLHTRASRAGLPGESITRSCGRRRIGRRTEWCSPVSRLASGYRLFP